MNFDHGVPEHSVTVPVFDKGSQCACLIVLFGFKMHTDVFPFFPQTERHIQANCCQ